MISVVQCKIAFWIALSIGRPSQIRQDSMSVTFRRADWSRRRSQARAIAP